MNHFIHRRHAAPVIVSGLLALMLSACGGGGDATDSSSAAASSGGTRSTKASVSTEPSGTNCAFGGSRIDAGIDSNGNSTLDASEITSTQYACNGMPGAAGASGAAGATGATGAAGSNGASGSNGATRLVSIETEGPGANCAQGGSKINVGPDANGNGVLDSSEVASSAYVCAGAAGAAGATGTTGSAGANGHNSLIAITPEPKGANCTYAGTKVTSGLDANDDRVLDANEVTATHYDCNGAPGAGVTWMRVTANSAPMISGTGYLADSAAPVALTLPASPRVGELISVSGVGPGGWTIAQNAGQSIILGGAPSNAIAGLGWTAHGPARSWGSLASSSDGTKLVAVAEDGIYTSTDSGVTWVARAIASRYWWHRVASSSDGSKLVATGEDGIYTSTDSGVHWAHPFGGSNLYAVASSADGTKLLAGQSTTNGTVYTSTDSGATWTPHAGVGYVPDYWGAASSADGTKLVAVAMFGAFSYGSAGAIYTSVDSGAHWSTSMGGLSWTSVASSADGSKLVAATFDALYTSSDSGANWTLRTHCACGNVASSADGSKLVAAGFNASDSTYTSIDYGVTWTLRDSGNAGLAASSADGNKLVVAPYSAGSVRTSTNDRTSTGIAGSLGGGPFDSVDLQYIGSGTFIVRGFNSATGRFNVQ